MRRVDLHQTVARRKWRRWMAQVVARVAQLCVDDQIFQRSMERIHRSGRITHRSHVYQWLMRTNATHLAMGVRRLLDRQPKTYSLLHVVRSIHAMPQVITRRSFVGRYSRATKELGEADFDNLAGDGVDHLPQSVVASDLRSLEDLASDVRPVVDKVIAHSERIRGRVAGVTWNTLHEAVRVLDQMAVRYDLILRQNGWAGNSVAPADMFDLDGDLDHAWH